MSEFEAYQGPRGVTAIFAPSQPSETAAAWGALRSAMIRHMPDGFSRDEWAYLIQFLAPESLIGFVEVAFGRYVGARSDGFSQFAVGRKEVVLVLPNNVSLLGPLMIAVATLSASRVNVKVGSRGGDVVLPFLAFAARHASPVLARVLARVDARRLDRDSPTVTDWLRSADVRIAFGADAAIEAIEAAPHKATSRFLGFGDMHSEAWLYGAVTDDVVDALVKVFAVYGQAGCTSPRRVVLLNGSQRDLDSLEQRLAMRWESVLRGRVPMHIASENILIDQWCRSMGIHSVLVPGNRAVIMRSSKRTKMPAGTMVLQLEAADLSGAVSALPRNVQTLGLAVGSYERVVVPAVVNAGVRRVVPLARMHHFGAIWDGNLLPASFFDLMECSV